MKIVVQRVLHAEVLVEGDSVSKIARGYCLFICLEVGDDNNTIERFVKKVTNLRIFSDDTDKMNLNIQQVGGEILSISQFTLSWDGSKGHRPSFDKSMPPQEALLKFKLFNKLLREQGNIVKEGMFGKDMKVNLTNDGPVTFILDNI